MKNILIAFALLVTTVSGTALAQLQTRCFQDDQLVNTTLSFGRNAWAKKCGYITATREAYLNSESEYQVFSNGCYAYPAVPAGSTCQFHVPADVNAACVGGLVKLGTCVAGCYTPSQSVEFNGKMLSVPEAYEAKLSTVTALTKDASLEALDFNEQTIRSFVAGETQEDIFKLQTANGRVVEVTAEHPMLKADGNMVKARTLKEGDQLLGADGKALTLSKVTVFNFKGTVWNVRPESKAKIENVLNAEGFLTGSVRFQNEWAEDDYRLSLRDEIIIDGL